MAAHPVIDHISVTVADIERAERFYDAFLPLVGFDVSRKGRDVVEDREYTAVEYSDPAFLFALISPRSAYRATPATRRHPGALHHLAFRLESPVAVDEAYERARTIPGALVVHGPRYWPQYSPDYYACFITDTEGIRLELVHYAKG